MTYEDIKIDRKALEEIRNKILTENSWNTSKLNYAETQTYLVVWALSEYIQTFGIKPSFFLSVDGVELINAKRRNKGTRDAAGDAQKSSSRSSR